MIVVDDEGDAARGLSRARPRAPPTRAVRRSRAPSPAEPSQGTRRSDSLDEDLLFTAVRSSCEGRRAGAVRVTQSVDAVRREVRNDVLALVGVGAVALLLGLAVAWLLAGSLATPAALRSPAPRDESRGGDLDARARGRGLGRAARGRLGLQRDDRPASGALRAQREFVANASHQLRTPLTGLRLRLEAAALKSREPEVERELAAAERETERLARLLSELLTLAGERERPAPQPVDVGEATTAACARWRGPAERTGHRLRLEEGDPAEVAASPEDVAAMLDNLLENALNYSPPAPR